MKQATVKLPSGEYCFQEVPDWALKFEVYRVNGESIMLKWSNPDWPLRIHDTVRLMFYKGDMQNFGWQLLGEDPTNLKEQEAGEIVEAEVCEVCNGDGKETCTNPDHGFIVSLGFRDEGRLGCPVCGHDPEHKVKNGGVCDECNGTGKQSATAPLDSLAASLGIEKPFVVLKNKNDDNN